MQQLMTLNEWLGRNTLALAILAIALGIIIPIPDTPWLRTLVITLFSYMTFVTALGTSFKQFLRILKRPFIPIIILLLIHVVFPVIAWILGILFYPGDPVIRLGYLIGASIPIGVSSIIWSAIGKANVAMSIVAVTLDTLLVPFFLPLYYKFVVGQAVAIDYLKMMLDMLLMITLPSIFGMMIQDLSNGRVNRFQKSIGGVTAKIGWFFIVLINAALVMPMLTLDLRVIKVFATTLLVAALGYIVGYLAAYCLPSRDRDTELSMMYNVGMRNNSFGIVLALAYFPPSAAIPLMLFMLFQHPLAALATYLYTQKEKKLLALKV